MGIQFKSSPSVKVTSIQLTPDGKVLMSVKGLGDRMTEVKTPLTKYSYFHGWLGQIIGSVEYTEQPDGTCNFKIAKVSKNFKQDNPKGYPTRIQSREFASISKHHGTIHKNALKMLLSKSERRMELLGFMSLWHIATGYLIGEQHLFMGERRPSIRAFDLAKYKVKAA